MSLEAEIKNLTGAMTRLAEGVEKLLSISQPSAAPPVGTQATSVEFAEKAAAHAAKVTAEVAASGNAIKLPTPLEAELEADPIPAPTFEDAKRAFLAIAQKYGAVEGTKLSKDVLSRYGVPNLKALPVEQYADFIELCGTVVAGGAA